jgi:protein-tyrosine phosphatase
MSSQFEQHPLIAAQKNRLARFQVEESVDLHCHCLPGLDDGPQTMDEAVTLCRALVSNGITTVCATPHQLGRYEGRNSPAAVRLAVAELQAVLDERHIPLRILPGGDVRVDERLLQLVESDRICTLGDGGRYILIELPHETLFDLTRLIKSLAERGRRVILSHPERHMQLVRRDDLMRRWIDAGAWMQVTAGSVLGTFGPDAEAASWKWLKQGLIHIVATDAHDTLRRPPLFTRALELLTLRLGQTTSGRIALENPLKVLRGEALPPPPSQPALQEARR